MNAKTCKKLRKEARALSAGKPEYRMVTAIRKHKRVNAKGQTESYETGQALNHPDSTRGIYLALKRRERAKKA